MTYIRWTALNNFDTIIFHSRNQYLWSSESMNASVILKLEKNNTNMTCLFKETRMQKLYFLGEILCSVKII